MIPAPGTIHPATRRTGQGLEEAAPLGEAAPPVNVALRPRRAFPPVSHARWHRASAHWNRRNGMLWHCMPVPHRARNLLSAALLTILSGCANGGGDYPSLADRPAERLDGHLPADDARPAPAPAADAVPLELTAQLDQLVQEAHDANRRFAEKSPVAERLIGAAGAAPAGSESWAQATQALAGMVAARAQTAQPLAELDHIDVDDRIAHVPQTGTGPDQAPSATAAAIAQARATVSGLVADEDAVLARLDGRLAR